MCGGSNLSTDLLLWGIYIKKCISPVRICLQTRNARNASTKFRKTLESKKSGEISRNLRFSRFFVPASKSDTHHGWDSWTRTSEMQESKSCALPTWLYPNMFMLRYFITHKKYCQYKNPAEAGFLSLHHFLRPLSFSSTS